jgi:hypothetical protein
VLKKVEDGSDIRDPDESHSLLAAAIPKVAATTAPPPQATTYGSSNRTAPRNRSDQSSGWVFIGDNRADPLVLVETFLGEDDNDDMPPELILLAANRNKYRGHGKRQSTRCLRSKCKCIKEFVENAVKTLHQILVNAYKGMDDQKEWHIANLKSLFKKGDPSDPSNWRGICLKDMTARIMIATLNKERLLKILAKHGAETQYGSQKARGCQDGLFALRSAPRNSKAQHDLPTWALFSWTSSKLLTL